MPYSISQEQAAQEKLAQIWRASSRRERLALAERFGYAGSDDSKLRVMRRLLTGSLKEGQYAVVTDYFKPFVTQEDPNAWTGRIPPYSVTQSYTLNSQVMYAAIDGGGLLTWEAYLNTPTKEESLPALFKLYNDTVLEKLKQSPQVSGRIEGIAFSQKGANALADYLEIASGQPVVVPRGDYGIALVPTRFVYREGKRQPLQPQSYQRSFPKSKRDDMIRYANRSYGQMTRKGGRLA